MFLNTVLSDFRFATRLARRDPGLTALVVLTLSLGIGGVTAVFSVLKAVLLNQLPYGDPGRVVALSEIDAAGQVRSGVGAWTANEWRQRTSSLAHISLYGDGQRVLIDNGKAEVLRGLRVSFDFFDSLGEKMLLGRSFEPEDDRWPRNNVIILTYGLWIDHFGGDPKIIGRALNLSTESYRVIGVLPRDFHPLRMSNPAEKPVIFMPLGYDTQRATACRNCFGGNAIGRLKAGVTIEQARTELNTIMRELASEYPSDYNPRASVILEPLRDYLVGPIRVELWILMGAVSAVLLIVCTNIANLLLVRATARAKEMAIRAALGGTKWRIVRQAFSEALLLSIIGGGLGVVLAWVGILALTPLAPKELPRLDEVRMDSIVLLFGIVVSIVASLLFGTLPALRDSQLCLGAAMRGVNSTGGADPRGLIRRLLVVSEIALAFVLAVGTGLLAKSVARLNQVNSGFDSHQILTLTPALTGGRYDTTTATLEYYRQIEEKVRAIPGVISAGMISNVPMSHTEPTELRTDGSTVGIDSELPAADVFWASPSYFQVLKIPLERGRLFDQQDGVSRPPAAVISRSLARARFLHTDAIGKRIQLGREQDHGPWFTIVGVVGDVRNNGLDQKPDEAVYLPQSADPFHYTRLVVRTVGDPTHFGKLIRAAILSVDSMQAVFHVQPMDDYVASFLADRSFTLVLISSFGTLSVLLAALGVYGVISYAVGIRTREIAIRMALGAVNVTLVKMILQDTLVLLGWGLAGGVVLALSLARILSHLLFEVPATDLATSATAGCILTCAALLAGYIPARRAGSVDPAHALRA